MLDKEFNDLTMGEKFTLQKIVKKQKKGEELLAEEQALFDKFAEEFKSVEQSVKAKWPLIILLIVSAALAILSKV